MRHHILYLLGVEEPEFSAFLASVPSLDPANWEMLVRGSRWLSVTTDELDQPGELLARKFGVPVFELGVLENGVRWYVFYRGSGVVDRYSSDPVSYAPGGQAPPSVFAGNPSLYRDLLPEDTGVTEVKKLLAMQRVAGREFLVRFGAILGLPDPLASSGKFDSRPFIATKREASGRRPLPVDPEPDHGARRMAEEWEKGERSARRLLSAIDLGHGIRVTPVQGSHGLDHCWFLVDRGGWTVRGLELWDLRTAKVVRPLPLSRFPAGAALLGVDPTGEFVSGLAESGNERRLFVASLENGELVASFDFPFPRREVVGTAVDPEGRFVAAFGRRTFFFWDVQRKELAREIQVRSGWQSGVAFLPGSPVAVYWSDGRVTVVELESFSTVDLFDLGERPERETVHDLLAVPEEPTLVIAGRRGVWIRDVEKGAFVRHLHRPDQSDRRRFVERHLGELPRPLRRTRGVWVGLGDDEVLSLDYHHWSNVLATGNADSYVRIWDRSSFEVVSEFFELGGPVELVKFSQDGEVLWTEDGRGIVRTWAWRHT